MVVYHCQMVSACLCKALSMMASGLGVEPIIRYGTAEKSGSPATLYRDERCSPRQARFPEVKTLDQMEWSALTAEVGYAYQQQQGRYRFRHELRRLDQRHQWLRANRKTDRGWPILLPYRPRPQPVRTR